MNDSIGGGNVFDEYFGSQPPALPLDPVATLGPHVLAVHHLEHLGGDALGEDGAGHDVAHQELLHLLLVSHEAPEVFGGHAVEEGLVGGREEGEGALLGQHLVEAALPERLDHGGEAGVLLQDFDDVSGGHGEEGLVQHVNNAVVGHDVGGGDGHAVGRLHEAILVHVEDHGGALEGPDDEVVFEVGGATLARDDVVSHDPLQESGVVLQLVHDVLGHLVEGCVHGGE